MKDRSTPPKELAGLPVKHFPIPPVPPACIYFLCAGERLLYVGQTVSLLARLPSHAYRKFDRVFTLQMGRKHLDAVEGALIRALRPPGNGRTGKDGETMVAPWADAETDAESLEFAAGKGPAPATLLDRIRRNGQL